MEDASNPEPREPVASSSSSSSVAAESPPPSAPSTSRVEGEGVEGDEIEDVHLHHLYLRRHDRRRQWLRRPPRVSYRVNFTFSNVASSEMRDDVWSCLVVLVVFWFFAASMTLILGLYGSINLELGPNCSRLIQTNPIFVQSIKVEELDESKSGPMLYGYSKPPLLDVETTWTETHNVSIAANFHKEWIHFLNEGSKVHVSYSVKSPLPVSLVIARGRESLVEWIEDPSYPNTTLSWNIIYGMGTVQQEFSTSSSYYIAVGNLNSEEVKVELKFTVNAFLYDTSQAYYRCSLGNLSCSLKLFLLRENAAVLSSPGFKEGSPDNNWYIKVSYGPRWITYFVGSGVMTILLLLAFRLCNVFQFSSGESTGLQPGQMETERAPLLSPKEDDLSSWGSSYDSVSHDEEDLEEQLAVTALEGKPFGEGENHSNPRGLCVICFDAPRDCFFLPCGHCAACYACGSRIAEEDGSCPICRRKMKKVRKIFTV
ncbi:E3 ubiquitin-protein ligase APD2-like isoform X1 [Syzygium oleosum]|uniref:E3 ubiquitin-protein ligase APD2-like isoform X1 n=1 Tax=Syzygium oleosum TaxID=219896 RepID=UPI0011D27F41|nr:E3 ubiquitin-protein ligase APD2-like isoform X1 [Syzygium oleosum]